MAVGLLATPRATKDLDFLVHVADLPGVDTLMKRLGYRLASRTENFSRFEGRFPFQGTVDLQHAIRPGSISMLGRAGTRAIPGLRRKGRILLAEDLVGLKVQAMANDPERVDRDRADIVDVLRARGKRVQWTRVLGYYSDFGRRREGLKIRRRLTGK